jgi:hypothetical protein
LSEGRCGDRVTQEKTVERFVMIYRVSIPALNPERVASVLAELSGGRARPFRSSLPGSFMVISDHFAVEVCPDNPKATKSKSRDASVSALRVGDPLLDFPLPVAVTQAEIERVAAREGWRAEFLGGITPGIAARFLLAELWVENRVIVRLRSTGTGLTEAEIKRAAA